MSSAHLNPLNVRLLLHWFGRHVASDKVCDIALRKGLEDRGMKLSRREARRLIDSVVSDGISRSALPASPSRRPAINFRQFSAMLQSCSHRHETETTLRTGSRTLVNRNNAESGGRRKGVTFRDRYEGNGSDNSDEFGGSHRRSNHRALLRASLRRAAISSADGGNGLTAAGAGSMGNSASPGLRGRLRGALQAAADARGARRGSGCVDRETVRRAMVACGAPLESKLLRDLEKLFDHRGTGEINVEVRKEGWCWRKKTGVRRRVASSDEGRRNTRLQAMRRERVSCVSPVCWTFSSDGLHEAPENVASEFPEVIIRTLQPLTGLCSSKEREKREGEVMIRIVNLSRLPVAVVSPRER